jgi:SAM-dependent methyltransferase
MSGIRERTKVAAMEFAVRKLAPKFDGAWSLYVDRGRQVARQAEDEFVTSDGRTIPVFSEYRYGVKRALYRHLLVLETLKSRGVLSEPEIARLKTITGTRTLTEPLPSQIEFARTVAARLPGLFMPGWETDAEGPILRQREEDLRRIVGKFEAQHRKMFKLFAAADVLHLKPSASVLEIGYTTGGHSIFAFERLGLTAHGVDNFYEGITSDASQWKSSATLLGSKADFRFGDITTQTSYEPNSLDFIYSASTVEHIQDLPAAFAEMYRILKPGGAMIHNYGPFFCVDGGHMLGIGDAPWAHVRMSKDDFVRYAKEYRPHEAAAVEEWFTHGLQFDMPQRRVQQLVSLAGFRIAAWHAKASGRKHMNDLTPDIIRDCFVTYPAIGLEDLTSRSVTFVAVKPGG